MGGCSSAPTPPPFPFIHLRTRPDYFLTSLTCKNNHSLTIREIINPPKMFFRCDECRIALPNFTHEQHCMLCSYDLCINCISERNGVSVILTTMRESIAILQKAYGQIPPITSNIKQQHKAMEFLFSTTMEDSRKALYREPGLLDLLLTISSPSTYGKPSHPTSVQAAIQLLAITAISNLADSEDLVKPMLIAQPDRLISVLCEAIEFGTTRDVRFYGIAAFTNMLFVKGIPTQLYQSHPHISELAYVVAESDDMEKWMDGKHAALGVIISYAKEPSLKTKMAADVRWYNLCAKLITFKGVYAVPKFPQNAREGFTDDVKDRTLSLLILLMEGDLNNEVKPKVLTNANLIASIRQWRESPKTGVEEKFLAQQILHMVGLATRPRRVMKTYLTRIYYRNGGIGMGIASTVEMAPNDLSTIPRGPIHYSASAPPDRTIVEPDGSRVEMRLSKVELLDADEQEEAARSTNNPGVAIVRPEDDLEESGLSGIYNELGAVIAMTMPGLFDDVMNRIAAGGDQQQQQQPPPPVNNGNGAVVQFIDE
jgi:hypothetical protein